MLGPMRWSLLALLVAGCSAHANRVPPRLVWTRVSAGTTDHLDHLYCSAEGRISIGDSHGRRHSPAGGAAEAPAPPTDAVDPHVTARLGDRVYRVADDGHLMRSVDGGQHWSRGPQIAEPGNVLKEYRVRLLRLAVAPDGSQLYALGSALMVHDSLESAFVFLLRSDDDGGSWKRVWTGPDTGPMGMGHRDGPDIGGALAVAPDGTLLANAPDDSKLLASADGGKTFRARPTPARAPLFDLATDPGGAVYAVGRAGTVLVSADGKQFSIAPSGVSEDLTAVAPCGGAVWIAGSRGVLLRGVPAP